MRVAGCLENRWEVSEMNPNQPMPASRVKVLAAMAGAGALVAMGVVTATAHEGAAGRSCPTRARSRPEHH